VKKTLKLVALIAGTWSLAEFITMWRMQDTRLPLKKYLKIYFKGQKQAWNASVAAGEKLGERDMSGFKRDVTDLTTKKFYVK
jgi:hypothetical protein